MPEGGMLSNKVQRFTAQRIAEVNELVTQIESELATWHEAFTGANECFPPPAKKYIVRRIKTLGEELHSLCEEALALKQLKDWIKTCSYCRGSGYLMIAGDKSSCVMCGGSGTEFPPVCRRR